MSESKINLPVSSEWPSNDQFNHCQTFTWQLTLNAGERREIHITMTDSSGTNLSTGRFLITELIGWTTNPKPKGVFVVISGNKELPVPIECQTTINDVDDPIVSDVSADFCRVILSNVPKHSYVPTARIIDFAEEQLYLIVEELTGTSPQECIIILTGMMLYPPPAPKPPSAASLINPEFSLSSPPTISTASDTNSQPNSNSPNVTEEEN